MPINRLKSSFKRQAIEVRKFMLSNLPQVIAFYYGNLWTPKPNSLAERLDQFSKSQKDVFFIQVGSNDGFQHDPLCKFVKRDKWKGLLFQITISRTLIILLVNRLSSFLHLFHTRKSKITLLKILNLILCLTCKLKALMLKEYT